MDVKIRRGKQSTEYNGVSLWNFWKKPRVREIGYVLILVRDWSDWRCVKLLNILFSLHCMRCKRKILKGIYIELISCTFCNDGDDLRNEEDVKDRDKDVKDPMDLDDELDLNDGD